MEITLDFLEKEEACCGGVAWFKAQKKTSLDDVVSKLAEEGKIDWANWLLCHVFSHEQKVQFAVFSAEQVIHLFEKQNPGDNRPRLAIEAAKAVLKENTQATRDAAWAAARAAYAAARYAEEATRYAAYAAGDAAWAAARAAYAAWDAADAAWDAAYAAGDAASAADASAADAAWDAAYAASAADAWDAADAGKATGDAMKLKILIYGCSLLKIDTAGWAK